nr:MAG TPA: hypothetical protein [Caudoviricetes sp.]
MLIKNNPTGAVTPAGQNNPPAGLSRWAWIEMKHKK